jgi:heme/copper-type cytochrome/quinol oxidase subunit 2
MQTVLGKGGAAGVTKGGTQAGYKKVGRRNYFKISETMHVVMLFETWVVVVVVWVYMRVGEREREREREREKQFSRTKKVHVKNVGELTLIGMKFTSFHKREKGENVP